MSGGPISWRYVGANGSRSKRAKNRQYKAQRTRDDEIEDERKRILEKIAKANSQMLRPWMTR